MHLSAKAICGLVSLGALGWASAPVAVVSSANAFTLDGKNLALTGVTFWPVVLGDEIATNKASATLLFNDGSNVTLAPKTTLKLTGKDVSPIVVIESGSIDYKLVKDSKVSILRLEDAQIPDFKALATGKLPTGGHNAVLAASAATAAGAAGALAAAVASHGVVSSGSSSVVGALSSSAAATPSSASSDTTDLTLRALSLSKYK